MVVAKPDWFALKLRCAFSEGTLVEMVSAMPFPLLQSTPQRPLSHQRQ
jgi:hypothetical protein